MTDAQPPKQSIWRRLVPFALAVALIGYVAWQIDWRLFVDSLAGINHLGFFGFFVVFVFAVLSADVLATSFIYKRTVVPDLSYTNLWKVRAASYLPSLLNHHVGQAWLTYYLSKVYGASLKRVAGGTLGVYATWGGCVLFLAVIALGVSGKGTVYIAAILIAGLAYLALLAIKPKRLVDNNVAGPLFELGVGGHILGMVMRLPHMVVLFFGSWLPFFFFGVNIPFLDALTRVPILMVAVTLPLTPVGLGTRDAVSVELFQDYVARASTLEAKVSVIAACTASAAVILIIINATLGVLMMRSAMALTSSDEPDATP